MAAHGGRAGEKGGSAGGDGGASATLATLHRMSSSGGAPRAEGRAPMARDLGARGGAPGPPADQGAPAAPAAQHAPREPSRPATSTTDGPAPLSDTPSATSAAGGAALSAGGGGGTCRASMALPPTSPPRASVATQPATVTPSAASSLPSRAAASCQTPARVARARVAPLEGRAAACASPSASAPPTAPPTAPPQRPPAIQARLDRAARRFSLDEDEEEGQGARVAPLEARAAACAPAFLQSAVGQHIAEEEDDAGQGGQVPTAAPACSAATNRPAAPELDEGGSCRVTRGWGPPASSQRA